MGVTWDGSCQTAGQLGRRAVEDDAAADEHEPLDDVLDGPELVRDVEDRDAELARAARRGAPASDSCDSASTPVVGSSSASSAGSVASAFAMNARCCMPAGERAKRRVARGRRGRRARSRARPPSRSAARSGPNGPRTARRPAATTSRTVTGVPDDELRALREVADPRPRRRAAAAAPKSRTRPACRPLEPEHEAKQRRLAAAVRPGDRDELARLDRERRRPRARAGPPR